MSDARIQIGRQAALREAIDVAEGRPTSKAARILLSVFNGGAIPTAPDHIFYGHPASFDCPEQQGANCPPIIDTSTTVPFDVLHHAPSAGDLLVATLVGGRWVAEKGGRGQTKICLSVCAGMKLAGANITLFSGPATPIASCTTDATGCCTFQVSGTYTVQVSLNGTVIYSQQRNLPSGGTTIIGISHPAGYICCGGYLIPQVLTLTDGDGQVTLTYVPGFIAPLWAGGHSVSRTSCPVTTPGDICVAGAPSQGPVRVCYQMVCRSGQDPTFGIQRSWSWVYRQDEAGVPAWYQDPSGFSDGHFCVTAPPPPCGSPLTDTASFGANPTTASPFLLAGTPVPSANNATGDPVGGDITISAP